jgi:hypothetical protein
MLGAAAIVVASLDTEDAVAVVAVLETDILRSDSAVVAILLAVGVTDFFLPKNAAGNEDSRAACLGVIGVEEVEDMVSWVGWVGGEDFDDWLNILVVVMDVEDVEDDRYSNKK